MTLTIHAPTSDELWQQIVAGDAKPVVPVASTSTEVDAAPLPKSAALAVPLATETLELTQATSSTPATAQESDQRSNALDDATPLDVDSFPNKPRRSSPSPLATIANVQHLLRAYGITVRYDVIKKKLSIILPGHSGSPDNFDNVALTQIMSLAILNGMPIGSIPSSVEVIGDRNLLNPVAEWICSRLWDGVDRLPSLCDTLQECKDFPRALKDTLVRRWLLSAVAAAFEPRGFSCRGVLTLQGPQGIGKTRWASALVSEPTLAKHVIKLNHHLDAGDKDSQLSAITNWFVEIGELDSSLKKDIARLKGFLTADQDKIRRPYGRTESTYSRRTVFCATVNDANFLVDPTGNSRWWTIPLVDIDYAHGIDMQQVFAQLFQEYEAGAQWWLTPEEERQLAEQNSHHQTQSVIREKVLAIVDLTRIGANGLRAVTAMEVLRLVGVEHPTNPQLKECCGVLRSIGIEPKRHQGNTKWHVPFAACAESTSLEDSLY